MVVEFVFEFIEFGVGCFKIEGWLKGLEYVVIVT